MLHVREARELLEYDVWANARMARALDRPEAQDARIRRTWAHLAAAEDLWHARCAGLDYASIAVWPEWQVREASQRLLAVEERWRSMADAWADADLEHVIRFANTRGEACADRLGDIVRHLVNHGTHHRAQIAMLLRERGVAPENLDFIVYCRRKSARDA